MRPHSFWGVQIISFLIGIEFCKWSLVLRLVLHLSSFKTIVKKCTVTKPQFPAPLSSFCQHHPFDCFRKLFCFAHFVFVGSPPASISVFVRPLNGFIGVVHKFFVHLCHHCLPVLPLLMFLLVVGRDLSIYFLVKGTDSLDKVLVLLACVCKPPFFSTRIGINLLLVCVAVVYELGPTSCWSVLPQHKYHLCKFAACPIPPFLRFP